MKDNSRPFCNNATRSNRDITRDTIAIYCMHYFSAVHFVFLYLYQKEKNIMNFLPSFCCRDTFMSLMNFRVVFLLFFFSFLCCLQLSYVHGNNLHSCHRCVQQFRCSCELQQQVLVTLTHSLTLFTKQNQTNKKP